MIATGGTIGILGGGQLGRMLAIAAAQLGYRTIGFAPAGDNVMAEVAHDFFENGWDDHAALSAFAAKCDVVTWEFENVPLTTVDRITEAQLAPHPRALGIAQDRLKEKRFVEELGGQAAPFAPVSSEEDLAVAIERIGTPGILKTCREGYDGKGQWRLGSTAEAAALRFPGRPCVYEGFVDFEAEFSVILVRGSDGEVRYWDSAHNEHGGGILARSSLPAPPIIGRQVEEARSLAARVAEALGYVGVLTLEFFATADGPVFNEMAPRVHNSGHWTIEGAATSQFENHIRAICRAPLGETRTVAREVVMDNVIGSAIEGVFDRLCEPDTHVHVYGKASANEGRKMAHVTRLVR